MNELNLTLAEGSKIEKDAIENSSVDEYYTFLQANQARCEKIKREMEKSRNSG